MRGAINDCLYLLFMLNQKKILQKKIEEKKESEELTKQLNFCRWHKMFADFFIYFFICCPFFLLNAAAQAPPSRKDQYGSVCKSESGGHETENEGVGMGWGGGGRPAKFSARWLPVGIIWVGRVRGGGETFSSLPLFSCTVSRLEGSSRTLLLTQPLRDSFNSSLSMAPVIEPSERRRRGRSRAWRPGTRWRRRGEGWERRKLNCNFRAVTLSPRAGFTPLPYRRPLLRGWVENFLSESENREQELFEVGSESGIFIPTWPHSIKPHHNGQTSHR